jgi:hypothetical protein
MTPCFRKELYYLIKSGWFSEKKDHQYEQVHYRFRDCSGDYGSIGLSFSQRRIYRQRTEKKVRRFPCFYRVVIFPD